MQMTDIVSKTAKGAEEIKTRANKLPQQLRWLLIMVDGRLTVAQLFERCKGLGDPHALLNELLTENFIEVKDAGAASAPAGAAAPPGFRDAVRELTGTLHEALGPDADLFAEPMERAATRQQYLTALENARQILERLHGPVKATEFSHRGRALVDKFMPGA